MKLSNKINTIYQNGKGIYAIGAKGENSNFIVISNLSFEEELNIVVKGAENKRAELTMIDCKGIKKTNEVQISEKGILILKADKNTLITIEIAL